ncbi:hypothetical protein [Methylobacterium sp. Leaf112]|uniref:hypothetical protein n=1 Tax=Methylobacterium sp. Leaf112 TaxID=1736258 RepID=UPI000701B6FA|nr:hypothetical protein [Methylobacterium sp. Leaf112]KQP62144.1 hypothetical protein ASF52_05660 [Methylobacterium sp. Leaf112]
MTASELQEHRDELAPLKDARARRLGSKGLVKSAGSGGENVTREFGSFADLKGRIAELEALIRFGEGRYGALHLR